MKVEGSHFIITGGASGLGEATAKALVSKGACITILDRDTEKGPEICKALGEKVCFFQEVDVMDNESIEKAIDEACKHYGKLQGCINCAGGAIPAKTVDNKGRPLKMDNFEWTIRLNLIHSVAMSAKCAARMIKNEDEEKGVIINVASVAAFDGQNGQVPYSAAKGGIVGMTLPMARDLGKQGIRVNTIAPGVFATPLTAGMESDAGKRVGDSLKGQQVFPNKRFGLPDEFAHCVTFIVENSFLNGETIRLDAGIRMPKL
jgi:NAD(P)-dependent dehydrogenase (short-subunit alcohol dehydrogenase family)